MVKQTKAVLEMSSAPSTPIPLAMVPHIQLPSAIPTCDGRLIGGQRPTGDPARGGELDTNVEQRDQSRPAGSREDERTPG